MSAVAVPQPLNTTTPPPAAGRPTASASREPYRLSVEQYERMIDVGILTDADRVELLEGGMVTTVPRNPAHDGTLDLVEGALLPAAPAGWYIRMQRAIALADSQLEPDLAVVRGNRQSYLARHPGPADIGFVVEIANTSLESDKTDKARIYARAGIAVYWVVNLTDRQVEVYTQPAGPADVPSYAAMTAYRLGERVPVVLDGQTVAELPVEELLPPAENSGPA